MKQGRLGLTSYKDGAAMLSNDLKTTGINDFRCCRPERVPQRKM